MASFILPKVEGSDGDETLITSLDFSADGSLLFAGTADGFLSTVRRSGPFDEFVCREHHQDRLRPLWKSSLSPAQGLPLVFLDGGKTVLMRHASPVVRYRVLDGDGKTQQEFTLADEVARGVDLRETLQAKLQHELTENFSWLARAPEGPYPLQTVIHGCRRMYRFRQLSRDRSKLLCQTDDRTLLLSGKPWRIQAVLPRNEIPIAVSFSDKVTVLTLDGSIFVR